jgi:hypothetical protein
VRSRLSAFALVISLMTAAAAAAFAPAIPHACPPDQHACCQGPRLMACCPGDDDTQAPTSTPAGSRVDVNPLFTAMAPVTTPGASADPFLGALRDGPNRSPGRDLTTLLGTFRI